MLNEQTRDRLHDWLTTPNHEALYSFIETLVDQRDRAELLNRAYLHEIAVIRERTREVLEPLLNKPATAAPPKPTDKPQPAKAKPATKSKPVDLDLDIEL